MKDVITKTDVNSWGLELQRLDKILTYLNNLFLNVMVEPTCIVQIWSAIHEFWGVLRPILYEIDKEQMKEFDIRISELYKLVASASMKMQKDLNDGKAAVLDYRVYEELDKVYKDLMLTRQIIGLSIPTSERHVSKEARLRACFPRR